MCVCVCVCVCVTVCVPVHVHTSNHLFAVESPLIPLIDGPLLATLEGHRGPVSCVVCTHIPSATDTKQGALLLVTCSHDGTLKTWDLASLGVVQTLQAHEGAVLVVAATEDGKHAVSGGLDGTVR